VTGVLHLWQAVQVVIDLAVSSCVRHLAARLSAAAAFRNLVVDAYADLDLRRVHAIASAGPADLRAFLAALRDRAT
jgi:uncharacterized protein YutE (UPF0331/DUF86 family)